VSLPTNSLRWDELRARAVSFWPGLPRGLMPAIGATWLLAGGFAIALKVQRAWSYPLALRVDQRLALLWPELGFASAMFCVCAVFAIVFARSPRWVLAWSQSLGVASIVLAVLAHGYYVASGQPLDYAMFAFSLQRADERFGVVASETHWELASGLIAVLLAVALIPHWIWRRRSVERRPPAEIARDESTRAASDPLRSRIAAVVGLSALAAAGFGLTGYSPSRRIDRSVARDPVTMLALGLLRAQFPDARYRGTPSRMRKTGPAALNALAGKEQRNVVVILLESTRADATTVYDKTLPTTPFLERFARESVIVDRAYTVVPHTTKALVAILCGFEPEVTLSTIESQPGGLPGRCLPSLLAAQGYDTAFFQAPTGRFEDRKMLAENLGFATFVSGDEAPKHGFERINYFGFEDAIMLAPSEDWLAARGSRPFMAAYLTSASHHPYAVPSHHKPQAFAEQRQRNKYLNAIHYADQVVERVIDQYRRLGLLERTVFVVVGDHGEAFGEHGLWTHDDVVFEEALRVPLLFRLPKAEQAGRRISGPVSELAIVPSLIGLAGFEPRDADYEQGSLFEQPEQREPPRSAGDRQSPATVAHATVPEPPRSAGDRQSPATVAHATVPALYAHCYRADRCAALIRDPFKLIHHFEERPAELYDLSKDPGEEDDIAGDHPDLVERWSRELADVRLSVHATYREASARALSRFVTATPPAKLPKPMNARFGDYLTLVGIRPPSDTALREFGKPGFVRFYMSYYFHVERRIPAGFTLRLQMRGERGSLSGQHNPLRGLLPIEDFPAGKYVEDAHRVSLPDNWQSPTLGLCLSLVDGHGNPVPVTMPGQTADAACVPVITVDVHR
jgi:lipoteichoic acid synthase